MKKLLGIFRSPALSAVVRWAKCVRWRLAAVCLLAVISILVSLGTTVVTKGLIDSATAQEKDWNTVAAYGAVFVALIVGGRLLHLLSAVVRIRMASRLQKNLQGEVMDDILSREYAGLKKFHSGELVSRVFSDVGVVKSGITSLLPSACSLLVSFFGAAAILWTMDHQLVLVLIGINLAGAVFMLFFREPMKRRHKRMQQAESKLHASIQETLGNIRTVKAGLSERRIMQRVRGDQQELEHEQRRQGYFSLAMNQSLGVIFDISYLACMLWGCYHIFEGQMTYGALAAMIQLIGRIQGPIAGAADLVGQAYGVVASAERLQEIITLPKEEEGVTVSDFSSIRLRGVSFTYDDGNEEVLRNITCDIVKGDFVALTGISGGGKTSLFQLLLGMFRPTEGSIMFETEQGQMAASRATRSLFSYVPQGNTLISGTLRENIRLFCGDASDADIMKAAQAACIADVVEELGLDARIGERGTGLSEGQAQRIAVARALLSDAPILLLDEATSALDDVTEAQMLANIAAMQSKTCIIVTHRSAALAICNKQYHISEGRAEVRKGE